MSLVGCSSDTTVQLSVGLQQHRIKTHIWMVYGIGKRSGSFGVGKSVKVYCCVGRYGQCQGRGRYVDVVDFFLRYTTVARRVAY